MMEVDSVLGPLAINQLGWVLMHEHVICSFPGFEMDGRNTADRERDLVAISRELAELRQYGVRTIVDPTPVDLGRDVGFLVEVARRSGLNLVTATGLYTEDLCFPAYFRMRTVDELVQWMVWEITEGISGSGVKAGVIKVAAGQGRIGANEEKALRAAARAQKLTGAPILTHTAEGTMGKEQLDVFEEEGADLSRIVVGHSCGNSDLRYHFDILRRGAVIGLDRIGMETLGRTKIMPDQVRRGLATSLIASGYAPQLVLSQDIVGTYYGWPTVMPQGLDNPCHRPFSYIFTDFIPKLRQAGISDRAIETAMVEVPRRVFGG